jgi:peroxiredoxin
MLLFALLHAALATAPTVMAGEDAVLFTLPVINGNAKDTSRMQVSLGDYTGIDPMNPRKAVVVYFFTRAAAGTDLDALDRLQKKYAGKGLQVLAISVDTESTGALSEWLGSMKLGFPVLTDQYQIVRARYGVDAPPVTYVIDADGVLHSAGNPHGADFETELDAQLQPLLK